MSIVKVGDKIPLVAQLECYESGLYYVDAVLKKPDRTNLLSPVDLGHEGDGVYFNGNISMPDEDYLTVTYRIFDDVGKTTVSEDFCQITEVITKAVEQVQDELMDLVDATKSQVLAIGSVLPDQEIVGLISGDSAFGEVDEDSELTGVVTSDSVSGDVDQDIELNGNL